MRRARARGHVPKAPFHSAPSIINPNGAIAGYYIDSALVGHGFLRDKNGAFTTFDAPGAGTELARVRLASQSAPVGRLQDSTLTRPMRATVSCGIRMVSSPPIDVPGSGTGPGQGTFGGGFTPNGTIMGNYVDADNLSHGFLMDKNGAFTTFDTPGAGTGPFQGTYPFGINANGAITGWYVDATDVNHGFVRDKHGAIVEFDVPGAGTGPFQGPNVWSIAPNGAVTGFYFDPDNVVHGFVREAHGGALTKLTDITGRSDAATP